MATKQVFGNKTITLPGSYARVISGVTNPTQTLSYGNILLIDTAVDPNYGAGAGIAGELSKNKSSILSFSNLRDFRQVVRGGIYWSIAKKLFQPNGIGSVGVSTINYVRALTTTSPELTLDFGDAGYSYSPTDGAQFVFKAIDEGLAGNGYLSGLNLTRGYAVKLRAGQTANKYILDFYAGTYKGVDENGVVYADAPGVGTLEADSVPELLFSSPEVGSAIELKIWLDKNTLFKSYFKIDTYTLYGTGDITPTDLTNYSSFQVFSGGTQTYNSTYLQQVLDNVGELDYTFVLTDNYGENAKDEENSLILDHIVNVAKFDKFLVIGGGLDQDAFNTAEGSVGVSEYYDNSRVITVHGGIVKNTKVGQVINNSFHHAAYQLGRMAGVEPQVPLTFKSIDIDGIVHSLNTAEKELALEKGVWAIDWDSDFQRFVTLQSVNSKQDNDFLISEDGTSYEVSVMRIFAQLNKELMVNSKLQLLSSPTGVNRGSLTTEGIKTWVDNYLSTRTVNRNAGNINNLIIAYRNINVVLNEDAYEVSYEAIPNTPINKLFFTTKAVLS